MKVSGQFFDAQDALYVQNFEISMAIYNAENRLGLTFHDSTHSSRRLEYPWVVQNIRQMSGIVLDAGSGETAIGMMLASKNREVVCVDNYMPTIDQLNIIAKKFHMKNFSAEYGDITKLKYADNFFDVSYCISVLEHLPQDQIFIAMSELLRVTKHKVLITLDIMLEAGNGFDINMLVKFMEQFGLAVQPPATVFDIDNHDLGVYCLIFDKD